MDEMIKRLRVSRQAQSEEILKFWRDHGCEWARSEASYDDIVKLVTISQSAQAAAPESAEAIAVSQLQAIWDAGFPGEPAPYGWNEMDDRLPPAALTAFIRGVEDAWNEVKDKL
jgi:hypothetical protein